MTNAASGMLIRKTARHVHSTSHPPRNGPTAPATPPSPDQAPTAAARSGPWNEAEIRARLPGVSSAPPMPCSARAAIRTSTVGARPQASDASANHATPMRKIRLRPKWSPSAPPSRISDASASV